MHCWHVWGVWLPAGRRFIEVFPWYLTVVLYGLVSKHIIYLTHLFKRWVPTAKQLSKCLLPKSDAYVFLVTFTSLWGILETFSLCLLPCHSMRVQDKGIMTTNKHRKTKWLGDLGLWVAVWNAIIKWLLCASCLKETQSTMREAWRSHSLTRLFCICAGTKKVF